MSRPFILAVLPLIAAAFAAVAQPEKLEPVPDSSVIEQAEKLVKEIYKADYAKKKASDQLDLAQKLLKAGEETKELSAQFVMFREARELAAKGGDVYLALDAANHTAKTFAVKSLDLKAETIEIAEKARIATPRSIAEAALELVDEAIIADDFATADRILKLASSAVGRGGVAAAISAIVAARIKELEIIRKAYDALEPERKAIVAKADDPDANAKLGRFNCFLKGNWDVGLPMLEKGNDESLQAAAKLDLGRSMPSERAVVADRWLEQVEKLDPSERAEVRVRAYLAYTQAVIDATGLEKSRLDKRLTDLEKIEPKLVRLKGGWTIVFRSADPAIWNTNVNRGRDQFSMSLAKAPADTRYLKMTEAAKNTYVIVEVSKARLGDITDQNGYGWNGKNNKIDKNSRPTHLGIYDKAWTDMRKTSISVCHLENLNEYRGWGFGHRPYQGSEDDEQSYSWNGEAITKTVIEISVKGGSLSAEESKRLLKKKK